MRSVVVAALVLVATAVMVAQPPLSVFVATDDMTLYSSPPRRLGPIPFIRLPPGEEGDLLTGAVFRIVARTSLEEPPWFHVETADGRDGWLGPVTSMALVPMSAEAAATFDLDESVFDAAIDYYKTIDQQPAIDALEIARDNAARSEPPC